MSGKRAASAAKKRKTKRDHSSEEDESESADSFVVDDSEEEESDDDYDSDDDDRDPGGTRKKKPGKEWLPKGKPRCRYGAGCTRKNPIHFQDESHPHDHPLVPKTSGGASDKDDDFWLPKDKPKCKYGLGCRRQNPTHFAEESHPSKHASPHIPRPPPSAKVDDEPPAKTSAKESKKDDTKKRSDSTASKKDVTKKRSDSAASKKRTLDASEDEDKIGRSASKAAKRAVDDDAKRKAPAVEKEPEKRAVKKEKVEDKSEANADKPKIKAEDAPAPGGLVRTKAVGGAAKTEDNPPSKKDPTPPPVRAKDGDTDMADVKPETKKTEPDKSHTAKDEARSKADPIKPKDEEGARSAGSDVDAKQVMEAEAALPVVSLAVADLDDAGDRGWNGSGKQTMALPLLCCDDFLACDPKIAARAAMAAIGEFLRKYDTEDDIRILLVEPRDSAAFKALTDHCTVSDKRLRVAVGGGPKAIGKLGGLGVQCGMVAVEADVLFPRGKRPSRGRARIVYDASGSETSAGYLGKATAAQYRAAGVAVVGKAYAVEVPPSSKLNSDQGCHRVIQVVVPSMNSAHEKAILDPQRCFELLLSSYRSTLDIFFVLRKRG